MYCTNFTKQTPSTIIRRNCAQPLTLDPNALVPFAENRTKTATKPKRHRGKPFKIVVTTSVFLIAAGLLIGIGSIVLFPYLTATLADVETKVSSSLQQASAALSNAQDIVASAQKTVADAGSTVNEAVPALDNGAEMSGEIAVTLDGLGVTISDMGNALSVIGIGSLDWFPFNSLGDTLSSIRAPIQNASGNLREISSSLRNVAQQANNLPKDLETINTQLDTFQARLNDLKSLVDETETTIHTYFDQAKTVTLAATAGFAAFGAILVLVGVSLLSLRKAINETNRKVEDLRSSREPQPPPQLNLNRNPANHWSLPNSFQLVSVCL